MCSGRLWHAIFPASKCQGQKALVKLKGGDAWASTKKIRMRWCIIWLYVAITIRKHPYVYIYMYISLYNYIYMYPSMCIHAYVSIHPSIHPYIYLCYKEIQPFLPFSKRKKKCCFHSGNARKLATWTQTPKRQGSPNHLQIGSFPIFLAKTPRIVFLRGAAWQSTALQALVEKPAKGQTFQATWKIHLLQIAIEEASRWHNDPNKVFSNHQHMSGVQMDQRPVVRHMRYNYIITYIYIYTYLDQTVNYHKFLWILLIPEWTG